MFVKRKTITIDAPPEAVYDYVSDISRHTEWARHKLIISEGRRGSLRVVDGGHAPRAEDKGS